jgi:glycosyltransferase involved in cell wall biosynthesis
LSSAARVLHLLGTGEANARGLANTVLNLASHGDASRYRLSVLFLHSDGPIGDRLRARGIDARSVNWTGGKHEAAGAIRFVRALRKVHPDIIHVHAGGLSPRFLGKAASGSKVIVHYHSLREESGRNVKRSGRAADLVIANSRSTATTIRDCTPLVIYPGVNVGPRARRRNRSSVIIGTLGRLVPVKGISTLLSSMAVLLNKFPATKLEIAGEGPERERLEERANALAIESNVRFVGWKSDSAGALRRWDIYAQPSAAEGFGIAALEAMAAGLPVVASATGGLREAVVNRETGILVPPLDSSLLASALIELIGDSALRARLGDAGRERADTEFPISREVEEIQAAYASLLA